MSLKDELRDLRKLIVSTTKKSIYVLPPLRKEGDSEISLQDIKVGDEEEVPQEKRLRLGLTSTKFNMTFRFCLTAIKSLIFQSSMENSTVTHSLDFKLFY